MSSAEQPSRRDCLINAASRLFASRGFEGTTVRQIARQCSITEAAIYKHFDSKEHLYEEVVRAKSKQHLIDQYLQGQRRQGGIEDVLTTIARHILQTAREDSELIRMLLFTSLEGFRGHALLYKEFRWPYIKFLRAELNERMASGEIRQINPIITSRCFVGMVMDCALNVELWNDMESTSYSAEAVIGNNVPIFARGLKNESKSEA